MNDFTILHLSDLHINREGKQLSVLMENLLKDIKSEMRVSDERKFTKRSTLYRLGNCPVHKSYTAGSTFFRDDSL